MPPRSSEGIPTNTKVAGGNYATGYYTRGDLYIRTSDKDATEYTTKIRVDDETQAIDYLKKVEKAGWNAIKPKEIEKLLGVLESVNEARFDAEKALHWHEPSKVIPEMVAAALIKSKPSDFYELMDLLGEYNISFELETAGSRAMEPNSTPSQIKQAVKYMNWDAFQDDNEIIQLQDYIEEIIGPF